MSSQGYYYNPSAAPINMPQKPGYYAPPQYAQYGPYSRLSISPPETAGSGTTSGVASYEPSAASSSYAGSASDYDTSATGAPGGPSVDVLSYMSDRLNSSYNPMPLDRSLVTQAQTSGQLNAKHQELLELQARARARLQAVQADFAEGMKTAKQVQRDLEWTQKRVASINERAARKYPEQYAAASARYPAPIDS